MSRSDHLALDSLEAQTESKAGEITFFFYTVDLIQQRSHLVGHVCMHVCGVSTCIVHILVCVCIYVCRPL